MPSLILYLLLIIPIQLSKFTSAMYAEMPPQEKEQWNANAEADRVRYLAELAEYVPPPGYDTKGDAIEFAQVLQAKKGSAARDANAPKKSEQETKLLFVRVLLIWLLT